MEQGTYPVFYDIVTTKFRCFAILVNGCTKSYGKLRLKMNDLIDILDIIGVVAFAISGAMTAIKKRMDLLGVCVLGIATAVGGGVTRDVLLGNTPPSAFKDPRDVCIAAIISCIVFGFMLIKASEHIKEQSAGFMAVYENVLMLSDAVGLGAFTVIGIDVAKKTVSDYNTNTFLLMFVGVITGVGGGILRDIMSGVIPYIFKKHIYAVASAAGAGAYIAIDNYIGRNTAIVGCSVLVVAVRVLAAHFEWNLPKIKYGE